MLLRKLFIGGALAAAIAVTALFTSFAASSANAEGGQTMTNQPIPYYVLRWENPLLPPTPIRPVFGP